MTSTAIGIPPKRTFQTKLEKQAYNATGVLFAINPRTGNNTRLCTVWNVAKIADGYEVATASHCATVDLQYPQGDLKFSVSYDDPQEGVVPTDTVPARLIAFGDQVNGEDVSLFDVQTTEKRPVLKLGDSGKIKVGESIINASVPFEGIDKGIYKGTIAGNSVVNEDPEVNGVIHAVIQGAGPGSSGSAVLSEKQKAVVGVLVMGSLEQSVVLCVPVNVLKNFISEHPEKTTPRIVPSDNPQAAQKSDQEEDLTPQLFSIQRNRGHSSSPRQDPSRENPRGEHQPVARTHQGPREHRRIDSRRSVRVINGHRQICFSGSWFYVAVWPDWVFLDDVYVIEGPDGVWFFYDYAYPNRFVQVVVIE